MLSAVLWICSAIAAALGLCHAIYVYRQETNEFQSALSRHSVSVRLRAGYYALWTLMLWLLLGATVVIYWVLALVPFLIATSIRGSRRNQTEVGHGSEASR